MSSESGEKRQNCALKSLIILAFAAQIKLRASRKRNQADFFKEMTETSEFAKEYIEMYSVHFMSLTAILSMIMGAQQLKKQYNVVRRITESEAKMYLKLILDQTASRSLSVQKNVVASLILISK